MNLVNELFIPKNIGADLKTSLLIFFNKIKNNQFIPECLKKVFITSIPKKRKSPMDLVNERGIFLTPRLRAILSKLIFNSIIDIIEDQLSPSNIGARRKRSPRDHLFVAYAVVNETVQSEDVPCKDLVFTDVTQCFDSLWTQKTLSDLYSNGVKTNLLNLLHELSKSAKIVIKTPVGNSEEGSIEDTIMQGETLSSILCTSTMDKMAKDSKAETLKYRDEVNIPKMGFVDDILDANKCGEKIKKMHEETVEQLNKRKLQINKDKSVKIHVKGRKDHNDCECEELFVDSWDIEKHETASGNILKDKYKGKHPVKKVEKYEYLGNVVEGDGSNKETMKERTAKGQGAVRDILQILEGCFFGDHYIEALKIMRNSKLTSVLTYNVEVIHNISKKEIEMLDRVDLQLLRQSMMLSKKSTRSLILLELGLIPVEYIVKQKRINFLHHLLTSDEESLSKKVFLKQREFPVKGDYVILVNKDLDDFKISMTYEEIKDMSKQKFKELVKGRTEKASLEKLLKEKNKLSKGKELEYTELKTQNYMRPGNKLSIHQMRKILQLRIRDTSVRANLKNAYQKTTCPALGCLEEETQFHLYSSDCWNKEGDGMLIKPNSSCYNDIFKDDIERQLEVMCVIFQRLAKRDQILRYDGPLDSRIPTLVIRKAKKKLKLQHKQQQLQSKKIN